MKNQLIVLLISGVVVGCSPDPESESRSDSGSTQSMDVPAAKAGSDSAMATVPAERSGAFAFTMTPEKAKQAIGNIRSYLVDLEGELRVGPAGTWQMKASSAQHIVGNLRIDVDTLARAGLEVGGLRSSLGSVAGALSDANEVNWNNIIGSAKNDINGMRGALSGLERAL